MMRTPMEHTGFPSEETLAAFIDGRLEDETRRRVVEHMAGCTECYETFLGATEWGREANVVPFERRSRKRAVVASVFATFGIAAALVIVILGPIRQWRRERMSGGGMASLAAVARALLSSPIQGRLTGGF